MRQSLLLIIIAGLASLYGSSANSAECRWVDPFHRAGHPETISPLAVFSNNCNYGGYYVGGGLPVDGESRCIFHEGTWGWDYFGILWPKRIALKWGHGSHEQGGTGAYRTEGPRLRHE
jgi:hypothetical protein